MHVRKSYIFIACLSICMAYGDLIIHVKMKESHLFFLFYFNSRLISCQKKGYKKGNSKIKIKIIFFDSAPWSRSHSTKHDFIKKKKTFIITLDQTFSSSTYSIWTIIWIFIISIQKSINNDMNLTSIWTIIWTIETSVVTIK